MWCQLVCNSNVLHPKCDGFRIYCFIHLQKMCSLVAMQKLNKKVEGRTNGGDNKYVDSITKLNFCKSWWKSSHGAVFIFAEQHGSAIYTESSTDDHTRTAGFILQHLIAPMNKLGGWVRPVIQIKAVLLTVSSVGDHTRNISDLGPVPVELFQEQNLVTFGTCDSDELLAVSTSVIEVYRFCSWLMSVGRSSRSLFW